MKVKNDECFFCIVDEETWKKGGELVKIMPYLKTYCEITWTEEETRDIFMLLCELLKGNAIPTKTLNLSSDEKEEMKVKELIMKMIYK